MKYKKEVMINILLRLFTIGVGLYSVPLLINYLGDDKYGIWVMLLSVISWIGLSDFGIGNGLKNKIIHNMEKKKYEVVQEYIMYAYINVSKGIIFVLIISIGIIKIVGVEKIFSIEKNFENEYTIYLTIIFFSINFILSIIKSVFNSLKQSYYSGIIQFLYSIILILVLLNINKFKFEYKLLLVAFIYGIINIISTLIVTWRFFYKNKSIRPKSTKILKVKNEKIIGIGLAFFFIQISGIILFTTDNLLISHFIGVEKITEYSLINKIFTNLNIIFGFVIIPLWTRISIYNSLNEYINMKNFLKKIFKLWGLFSVVVILIGINTNLILKLWLNSTVYYFSIEMVFLFILYTIVFNLNEIIINTMNGLNKIKIQLYLLSFQAILNIPLSYYFGVRLNLGLLGIKLATLCCILITTVVLGLKLKIEMNKMNRSII